ncbi:MAG: agmatine deiminase family protein [Deltaproteobacteria bacterium]|nr:agmatine deiminase family protein [Deltaproteobacteria bacterium]
MNWFVPKVSQTAYSYRMPAEWEFHEATWLAWPHNPDTWQGRQKFVFPIWVELIKVLHLHERVHILVNDEKMETEVRARLEKADIDFKKARLHKIPTNDCWMRDIGPTFLSPPALINWVFNSWGEKWPPWDQDALVSSRIAEKMRPLPFLRPGIVLEGGSIETNGQGVLLTTESCLLHPKRNPNLRKEEIEKVLKDYLGVTKVLWLQAGAPEGDDTDGHIDNLARFVSPNQIMAPHTDDPKDLNYSLYNDNLDALKSMTDLQGKPFEVIPLPVPKPIIFNNTPLPASYANFYIANGVVLLPIFGDPKDDEAIRLFKTLFPKRRIVPILSRDLVIGFGGIHCVTQQQPR